MILGLATIRKKKCLDFSNFNNFATLYEIFRNSYLNVSQ